MAEKLLISVYQEGSSVIFQGRSEKERDGRRKTDAKVVTSARTIADLCEQVRLSGVIPVILDEQGVRANIDLKWRYPNGQGARPLTPAEIEEFERTMGG